MFGKSLEKIRLRGGANPRDKTLVDGLDQVVGSLNETAKQKLDILYAMKMAADIAKIGSESTKNLVAKQGKARYLGQQTLGHTDPGAEVIRLVSETLLTTYESTDPSD